MSTNGILSYRVMFWTIASVATVCLVTGYFATRGVDPRLYDPHGLSELRDISYPFTVEVYGYTYRGKTGDYIDDHILSYGAYEKDVLFFLRDYVQARGNPNAVFLDVGACEGQHSLFMSRLVKDVHAFEPYPPAAERFRGLVGLNGFTNVRLHEVGLGETDATVPFYAPPEKNLGSGTFLPEHKDGAGRSAGSFRVVVGDDWLAPLALGSVDVIKVDVEGFEKNVLRGLTKTLARHRPVLVIEVTHPPRGTIASLGELKRLLPAGYAILRFQNYREQVITGNYVLEDVDHFATDAPYEMMVAYPKERDSLIHRRRPTAVHSRVAHEFE